MSTDRPKEELRGRKTLAQIVQRKAARRLRARREGDRGIWFGLGMMGVVGWSVAVPTLAGIALGVWLDGRLADRFSWTLAGLGLGIAFGCLNAWIWVRRESREP
jgi:ATP synthase protein I